MIIATWMIGASVALSLTILIILYSIKTIERGSLVGNSFRTATATPGQANFVTIFGLTCVIIIDCIAIAITIAV